MVDEVVIVLSTIANYCKLNDNTWGLQGCLVSLMTEQQKPALFNIFNIKGRISVW